MAGEHVGAQIGVLKRSDCSNAGSLELPVWLAAAAKPPPKALTDEAAPKGAAGNAGAPKGAAGDAEATKAGAPSAPNPGVALAAKAGVADWPKPARPQTSSFSILALPIDSQPILFQCVYSERMFSIRTQ